MTEISGSMSFAIQTQALTKTFGQRKAIDELTLEVPSGSVYGFLGPNGSGKTTAIRLLLGLIRGDSGSISVLGKQMPKGRAAVLRDIGALVESPGFVPYLTGRDNLMRLLSARGVRPRSQRMELALVSLARVGLTKAGEQKVKQYSLGMKQRLGLAWALCLPRELYVLDEPTNGLDPAGMREMRSLISEISMTGSTIFVSSHLLAEIEQVCTHVAFMSRGKVVAAGRKEELWGKEAAKLNIVLDSPEAAASFLSQRFPGIEINIIKEQTPVLECILDSRTEPYELNEALVSAGFRVHSFERATFKLEDAFSRYVGEGFDVD